jgi:hypothetical protein
MDVSNKFSSGRVVDVVLFIDVIDDLCAESEVMDE